MDDRRGGAGVDRGPYGRPVAGTDSCLLYTSTDSLRLSEEAIAAAKGFIESRYGKAYYPCLLYTSRCV